MGQGVLNKVRLILAQSQHGHQFEDPEPLDHLNDIQLTSQILLNDVVLALPLHVSAMPN